MAWVGSRQSIGLRTPLHVERYQPNGMPTLVVKMAKGNPSRGYDRIQGALKNSGHTIVPTTIRNMLRRGSLEPAPLRKSKIAWKAFLKANWFSLAAADFFTTEIWTSRGLVTFYTLFVIDLATAL